MISPATIEASRESPESDSLYEIVDGRRVEKRPMGNLEAAVTSVLTRELGSFVKDSGLGRVVSEMLFRLHPPGKPQRRPDCAFVSYDRWPRARKLNSDNGLDVVPDLVVEVISPSDLCVATLEKVHEYLGAGVRRVWLVFPTIRQVYIIESPTDVRVIGLNDSLDGEDLLSGFRLGLAELFEDGAEA